MLGIRIVPADALRGFEPRKTPIQTRATVTVGAISEATIQVLLKQGVNRLTTTRVAERAGVSVGTLYQYYRTSSRCCARSWRTISTKSPLRSRRLAKTRATNRSPT